MKNKSQSATTSDGTPKGIPSGQSGAIEQMNNPKGMAKLKSKRNTGEIKKGTAFLRSNKAGVQGNG